MQFRPICCLLVLGGLTLGWACAPKPAEVPTTGKTITAFTTILPAAYFIQRIGGDRVTAKALIEPGTDVHTFDPAPRQLAELAQANFYFALGVPFENNLLGKIQSNFPNLKVVSLQTGIAFLQPPDQDEGDRDPHVWISPVEVKILVKNLTQALDDAYPADRALFDRNLTQVLAELDQLEVDLRAAFAPVQGGTFFVYHPSLGYLAHDFGLVQEALEVDGKAPSAQNLRHLVDLARQRNIRVIFVQAEFDPSLARTVADSIGGAVVPFNDLAYDYFTNLRGLAAQLKAALPRP